MPAHLAQAPAAGAAQLNTVQPTVEAHPPRPTDVAEDRPEWRTAHLRLAAPAAVLGDAGDVEGAGRGAANCTGSAVGCHQLRVQRQRRVPPLAP